MNKTAGLTLGVIILAATLGIVANAATPTHYTHIYSGTVKGTVGSDTVKNVTFPYKSDKAYNITVVIDFANYTTASDFKVELKNATSTQYAIEADYSDASNIVIKANSQTFTVAKTDQMTVQATYDNATNTLDSVAPYNNASTDTQTRMPTYLTVTNKAQVADNSVTYTIYYYTATPSRAETMSGIVSIAVPLFIALAVVSALLSFAKRR